MKVCGIYKITSPVGKVYIGQSKDCSKRQLQYKKTLALSQTKLHNSILKYGWKNHIFEVIHECDAKDLDKREKYYISIYNCFNTTEGLNLTDGGRHYKKSTELIEKQRENNKNKNNWNQKRGKSDALKSQLGFSDYIGKIIAVKSYKEEIHPKEIIRMALSQYFDRLEANTQKEWMQYYNLKESKEYDQICPNSKG